MVFWIKQKDGRVARVEDSWTHSIYVATDQDNASGLGLVTQDPDICRLIKSYRIVTKRERITDNKTSAVLELALRDSRQAVKLARLVEKLGRFGRYRLYNVDLLPAQCYFYQHDLFPLANCTVSQSAEGETARLKWQVHDSVWETSYRLPNFNSIRLEVAIKKQGKLPKFTDPLDCITIKKLTSGNSGRVAATITLRVRGTPDGEAGVIRGLADTVSSIDPDFIFTSDGDSFVLPYLIYRAEQNGMSLSLNREKGASLRRPNKKGVSYFSYGRIYFKPSAIKLLGRVHCDSENSFVWNESGMQGLYELARICRMPLHTAFRASIGKCLSSLQFYHATKRGMLVPWKPYIIEHPKSLAELMVADRGGMVFDPEVGVHEKVAEFDFVSLYPNIMRKCNISAETVRCRCCRQSPEHNRVPELGCNICRMIGIVPTALKIVIRKRSQYKALMRRCNKNAADHFAAEKKAFDARQNALKWINVTSFGYLGFNNAKFGRIDSHQAVCAYDRKILKDALDVVYGRGFRFIHGIVDSLWLHKSDATIDEYLRLKEAIEKTTGFEINFEGEYKWIVFVHSSGNEMLPVPNRYFGAFSEHNVKVRGIEARRHDTPEFLARFQAEIIDIVSRGRSAAEVRALMPEVKKAFAKYAEQLVQGNVPVEQLVFTKRLSKDWDRYAERNTVEHDAVMQLVREGRSLRAGEALSYIITQNRRQGRDHAGAEVRAVPVEFANGSTPYDAKRYVELLKKTCDSITGPFGIDIYDLDSCTLA
jgi:DNA polymerase-2